MISFWWTSAYLIFAAETCRIRCSETPLMVGKTVITQIHGKIFYPSNWFYHTCGFWTRLQRQPRLFGEPDDVFTSKNNTSAIMLTEVSGRVNTPYVFTLLAGESIQTTSACLRFKRPEVGTVLGGPLHSVRKKKVPRRGSESSNPSVFPRWLTGTIYQMGLKLNFNTLSFT